MPRIPRGLVGGGVVHVLNRGNGRGTVFHAPTEFDDFVALLKKASARHEVDLLAFCVMPNHFHLVVRAERSSELSAMMQWWLTSHVRRHHRRHDSTGHVWQGRYKAFPVQADEHLLTVLRYVLLNPTRAGLVSDPVEWPWSSLRYSSMIAPWPVRPAVLFADWLRVTTEDRDGEVRACIRRGTPFGAAEWREVTAREWGLEATLRPRGRPRSGFGAEPHPALAGAP